MEAPAVETVERPKRDGPAAHGHTHGSFFERYTYILSPIHSLDPRAKILACANWYKVFVPLPVNVSVVSAEAHAPPLTTMWLTTSLSDRLTATARLPE